MSQQKVRTIGARQVADRLDAAGVSRRVVFDIETAAQDRAAAWVPAVSAPGSYRDPVKIAAYVDRKRQELLDRAALDPDLGRIVAIGWWDEATGRTLSAIAKTERQERYLLRKWWTVAARAILVGYNCVAFDLPYLLRRSDYLGVPVARSFDLHPYRTRGDVVDLMIALSFGGILQRRSLSFHADRRALTGPADPITGADVPAAVLANDWSAVKKHVKRDVVITLKLARAVGVVPPLRRQQKGGRRATDSND